MIDTYYRQKVIIILIIILLSSFSAILIAQENNHFANKSAENPNQSILVNDNSFNFPPLNTKQLTLHSSELKTLNDQLFFQKNIGQIENNDVQYYFKSKNYEVDFSNKEIVFYKIVSNSTPSLVPSKSQIIKFSLSFQNSNDIIPIGINKLERYNNYFINNKKFTNIQLFRGIVYKNVYDGIDLNYYFYNQNLKYEFVVHPGAKPSQIKIKPSNNLVLSNFGHALLLKDKTSNFKLIYDENLYVYQNLNKAKQNITAHFNVNNNDGSFQYELGTYDTSHDLIIDPILLVNTSIYLGGSSEDIAYDLVLDSQKNIYITGSTQSIDFPVLNALYNTNNSLNNIFIMKLNPSASKILWSTYFGGNGEEQPDRIGLDGNNNVVITGYTNSTDFPKINSINDAINGSFDAFVVSLSNDGSKIILSSIFGGNGFDEAYGLFISKNSLDYYITGDYNFFQFYNYQKCF